MRLPFGIEITRQKAVPPPGYSVADNRGGWAPWIREPYSGAWQQNVEWTVDTVLAHHAVFACITLISADIGKLRTKLMEQDRETGIWEETFSPAFSPVLRKPNRYQDQIQFKEFWTTSKLIRGNTYVLLERDQRGVVVAQYILEPSRVQVYVAPDGSVFYALGQDNLSGIDETSVVVPASEIMHDRINCLFHPLVGISPLFACGVAANLGLRIINNSASFFANGSNPSGVLTAPGTISQVTADRLKAKWETEYSGVNSGKIAVLGDGLKFEAMRMTADESQLIEQLKWTADVVCSVFHVPPFKIGLGQMPTYQNAEVLNQIYYSDCLQSHIEHFEAVQDHGLGLQTPIQGPEGPKQLGVELDTDALLRMDQATTYATLEKGVKGGFLAPNEARFKIDKKPVPGGQTPYMQQQNFSLAALDARDRAGPAPSSTTAGAQPSPAPARDDRDDEEETNRTIDALIANYDFAAADMGVTTWA